MARLSEIRQWQIRHAVLATVTAASTAQTAADAAATAATTAQTTADAAADNAIAAGDSAGQGIAAVATATGAAAVPRYYHTGGTLVGLICSTAGSAIQYRLNGGSYGTYSTPFAMGSGEVLDAYATAGGLTDSAVLTYTRP